VKIVRPSRVDNVDDARIIDSIRQVNDRIATMDQPRGQMVRDCARRCIMQDAMRRRGYDIVVQGNPAACYSIFKITPPSS
jgi:hypothetical protein